MDPNYLNPSNRPSSLVRMLVLSGKCECVESVPGMVPGTYLFAVYVVMKLPLCHTFSTSCHHKKINECAPKLLGD